jgi:alkanesulfonate monooxygenase SsuD/methylene tetrahydromethanopterin reductase-like flavin-dependent oxidoreductase (luciferase family)
MLQPEREHAHPWIAEGQGALRFGISTAATGDWVALRDLAQMAEGLGFDSFWRPDHPLLMPDSWTTLAVVATSTSRMRLGTTVSCVYYRNPVLLARIVADVDRLSGGRVVLGLGAGDMEDEFRSMGLAYPPVRERLAALEEGLQIIPRLLSGETVTHAGTQFRVDAATLPFPPVQQPYVPLLVAGGGERTTLRLVAQYADASNMTAADWGGGAFTPADLEHKYAVLEEHCKSIGRPYTAVLRTYQFSPTLLGDTQAAVDAKRARMPPRILQFLGQAALIGTPEEAIERVRPFAEAGCQYFNFGVQDPDSLRLLAERVIPALVSAH